jgi:putative transposase
MTSTTDSNKIDTGAVVPAAIREQVAQLVEQAESDGIQLTGEGGLLPDMIKQAVEAALQGEMSAHLGYERYSPEGRGSGNSRNGSTAKTVQTAAGPARIEVPRDRAGTFEPVTVPKGARRFTEFDDMVIGLYAKGLTTRDIAEWLEATYGAKISHETVANITDSVNELVKAWRSRPLDEVYPIVYIDAIRVRVRDGGAVRIKACHLAVGVDMEGRKRVLGMWIEATEGARFWLGVLNELRNRGVRDVLIVCCDGLTGLPEAIGQVWANALVQTCVVHLIRNSMRYASWKDRKGIAAALRPIYTAPTPEAAQSALEDFASSELGRRCPAVVEVWRRAWNEFTPFLDLPPEIRKVVYTTNAIESINYQLRKVSKTRGQFPSDDAVYKILYLAVCDIETRDKARGGDAKKKSILSRGSTTHGWTAALNQFAILFPGRLPALI